MAEFETCAIQKIKTHTREAINIGDGSKPVLLHTIEYDGWDRLSACADTEKQARSGLEKLLAGYCSKKNNSFVVAAVFDCRYTRDGDVKIEEREKSPSLWKKIGDVWGAIWAADRRNQDFHMKHPLFGPKL